MKHGLKLAALALGLTALGILTIVAPFVALGWPI